MGLLTLLYAATRLLRNIEVALNEVWGTSEGRGLLAQFRDYILIIVVMPLSLMAAAALTTAGQALQLLRAAGEAVGLSALLDQLVSVVGPLVVLFLGLSLLYKVMPYTQVKLGSAMVGAAVGAVLWYAVLIAHLRFQVGVARFNALYSSFAVIPIFLAWLQISWLVVLVGAQIAATHQNSRLPAQRMRLASADHRVRETIAIAAMLRIGAAFTSGERAEHRRAGKGAGRTRAVSSRPAQEPVKRRAARARGGRRRRALRARARRQPDRAQDDPGRNPRDRSGVSSVANPGTH